MAEQKLALGRIFMTLVILTAVIGGLAYKYVIPKLQENQQAKKYDQASSGGRFDTNITVAGDPWSGYSLFRSDRFRTVPNFRLVTAMKQRKIWKNVFKDWSMANMILWSPQSTAIHSMPST